MKNKITNNFQSPHNIIYTNSGWGVNKANPNKNDILYAKNVKESFISDSVYRSCV